MCKLINRALQAGNKTDWRRFIARLIALFFVASVLLLFLLELVQIDRQGQHIRALISTPVPGANPAVAADIAVLSSTRVLTNLRTVTEITPTTDTMQVLLPTVTPEPPQATNTQSTPETITRVIISVGVSSTLAASTTAKGVQPGPVLHIPPPTLSPFRRVKVVVQTPTTGEPISQTAMPVAFQYVFPVQPPSVTSYQYGHHDYPATDIFAPRGTRFVAVTDGYIDEVGRVDYWNPTIDDPATRGGLYVSLIGDDGVRYYGSHLDEVTVGLQAGDRVVAGQVLGYVGSTGNARGISPHLHFGISYPTFPGDWEVRRGIIMPYQYLKAWQNNEQITPDLSQSR